jgi:hypothetical protein
MLLTVLLPSDTLNSFFRRSRMADSSILLFYELAFGVWLAVRCYRDTFILVLLFLPSLFVGRSGDALPIPHSSLSQLGDIDLPANLWRSAHLHGLSISGTSLVRTL